MHAEGEEKLVDDFIIAMSECAPPASDVKQIDIKDMPLQDFDSFEIRTSDGDEAKSVTLISPDLAICEDCKRELLDENDRRFRYPFINCTNCGPRYTIIEDLPYDRAKTSMKCFDMCTTCDKEYKDPMNRRFHAQPNACFDCGPHLIFRNFKDEPIVAKSREISDDLIAQTLDLIEDGKVVAVKGLGGFHFVCDANNSTALKALRSAKKRDNRAFALMVNSIEDAKAICFVSDEEENQLTSAARPIVLLKRKWDVDLHYEIAGDLDELGVMLPCTPLQVLLLDDWAKRKVNSAEVPMLIVTSGNIHDCPIVIDDDEAAKLFAGVVDAILGNDRKITTRFDDSVLRILNFEGEQSAVQVIRRARGFAPSPLKLPNCVEQGSVFATGPEQKNTFAFSKGSNVFISQHIGDVENADVYEFWHDAKDNMEHLFRIKDDCDVVCDMHPEYITTKWAESYHDNKGSEKSLLKTQHHHAHIVSALGENNFDSPCLGFAFDGTGFGPDGKIWGGEVLLSNMKTYERFANFAYFPLPTGAGAIKHLYRATLGLLYSCDLLEHEVAQSFAESLEDESKVLISVIEEGVNCPYTSSLGRIFDAVSVLIGICDKATYEGEGAIALEAAAHRAIRRGFKAEGKYEFAVQKNVANENSTALDTSVFVIDEKDVVLAILDDLKNGIDKDVIALKFCDAICDCVVLIAQLCANMYGIFDCVLSGGVWMNRYLIEKAVSELSRCGFSVILNKDLPPNDGCISYGEIVIKCALDKSDSEDSK